MTSVVERPDQPSDRLQEQLHRVFGFEQFRQGQRDVVEVIMRAEPALAVMPTGGGKSLCYQLPATLLPGLTIVISPLIALMKDQVDSLQARGVAATFINSSLPQKVQKTRLAAVQAREIQLLFVAPERFRNERFWEALDGVPVSLVAVDEAHCVSQWGHDFRPDYLTIKETCVRLGDPTLLAVTATATPMVRRDVLNQLGIRGAFELVSGFERANLFLDVRPAFGHTDKLRLVVRALRASSGAAIVYCTTRRAVDEVFEAVDGVILGVGRYHGGLDDAQREAMQEDFMDGELRVLISTNAFGMGVDKSDIRTIIHYQIPASLEAYYQEAGRAGRDGVPAYCLLLYDPADEKVPRFFIENNYPARETIIDVWHACQRADEAQFDRVDVSRYLVQRVHGLTVESALKLLARAGHLRRISGFGARYSVLDRAKVSHLRIDWPEYGRRREYEQERLKRMVGYAAGSGCRVGSVLRYFGQEHGRLERCDHCDTCVGPRKHRVPRRRDDWAPGEERSIRTKDSPTTLARKVLSAVARCGQREPARRVAQVLVGSRAQSLRRRDLHQLSTYGLLRGMTRRQAEALIDVLISEQVLVGSSGAVRLSREGVALMKGVGDLPASVELGIRRLLV